MSAAVVELRRIELPDVERQGVQASLSTSEASISPRSPGFPERGPGFLLLYLRYRARLRAVVEGMRHRTTDERDTYLAALDAVLAAMGGEEERK